MRRAASLLAAAVLAALAWWALRGRGASPSADPAGSAAPAARSRSPDRSRDQFRDRGPAVVGGRVTSAHTGEPIAGAWVAIDEKSLDGGALGRPGTSPEPMTARTGADGRWSIRGVPAGRYAVTASAPGYVPATLDDVAIAPRADRDDIDFALAPGGQPLRGTVSDIGGGPIDGAVVRAMPISDASPLRLPWTAYTTFTGPDGRYELYLGDGVYAVTASHVDYRKDDAVVEMRGAPRTQDFALVPGGVIHGVVRARDTDEPVAGALVADATALDGFRVQGIALRGATATDGDGRFSLRGLGSGVVHLTAVAPGYTAAAPTTVELGIGEEVDGVVVYVDRAHDIAGYVVRADDESAPVAGVLVGAYNFSPGALLVATRPSQADGYFEIHGVPDGHYVVGALSDGLVPNFTGASVDVAGADVRDVVVKMAAGVTLSGRVDPPQRARVRIEIATEDVGLANLVPTLGKALLATAADDTGAFALRAVTPGDITLVAIGDDGAKGSVPVQVRYRDIDGIVIPLSPRPHIAGVVVDARGTPVTDVQVRLVPRERPSTFLSVGLADIARGGGAGYPTGDDGSFWIPGVDPGTYDLSVVSRQGRLAWARPRRGDDPRTPLEVTVADASPGSSIDGLRLVVETRDGVIRGTVVDDHGTPIADAWVTARRSPPGAKRASPPREGASDDSGDAPSTGGATVTVTAGSDGADVETSDEPSGPVDPGGFDRAERPVLTGPDGRFEITGLRDGRYDLTAEGLRGRARATRERVPVGADVTLSLTTLSTLRGTVTLAGAPVTAYAIVADGPIRRRRQVLAGDGRYEIGRLEAGDYEVTVTSDRGSARDTVSVPKHGDATLDIHLVPYASVRGRVVDQRTGEPLAGMVVVATTEGPSDLGQQALDILTGEAPKTGDDGRFRVDHLAAGTGSLVVVDGALSGFQIVATREFTVAAGQDVDLGDIAGIPANPVPKDRRGWLGMTVRVASWAGRPRADGARSDAEPPDGVDPEADFLWVDSVVEGGPAAGAGLAVGDRVVAVDGIPIAAVGAKVAAQALASERVAIGQSVTIAFERDGDARSATVVAAEPP
ncbi:MAG: carboxypeptidase regulatory-like domain-containing protein [Deltaproteobacteria bacterium]|nr:MAG: carboxypeptidase regulatory-like domain-containing protein [Deltaproteobacteria bacterium]